MEHIKAASGVKSIEDIGGMVEFVLNYRRLIQERDTKEDKLHSMRELKK